jgi:hypothetical protein
LWFALVVLWVLAFQRPGFFAVKPAELVAGPRFAQPPSPFIALIAKLLHEIPLQRVTAADLHRLTGASALTALLTRQPH